MHTAPPTQTANFSHQLDAEEDLLRAWQCTKYGSEAPLLPPPSPPLPSSSMFYAGRAIAILTW